MINENAAALPPQEAMPDPAPAPALGPAGLTLLILSLLASGVYLFAHAFGHSLPGIGLTASHWALLAGALAAAGKHGALRMRKNPAGLFLLACAALLGACFGIFCSQTLRAMNLIVLIPLSAQAFFALTGQNAQGGLSAQGLWEGFRRFFRVAFASWDVPFRALSARKHADGKTVSGLFLGLALAVPVLTVALLLLSSADAVFGDTLAGSLRCLDRLDGVFLFRCVMLVLLGLMLFSCLFSALRPAAALPPAKGREAPPMMFSVVLFLLAAVYGLFVYIQFKYLFGSGETAMVAGGYAQYARSGFFELVALAGLTLLLILPAASLCKSSRAVRALGVLVALLTVVMDYSAFFRMRLYIREFGLTPLRIITLWGMAMILLALLLAMGKCLFPALKICPLLCAALVGTWVMLNYANVDRLTAESAVARYNAGRYDEISAADFFSPDALPSLEKIEDPQRREAIRKNVIRGFADDRPVPYDWALGWLRVPSARQEAAPLLDQIQ